MCYATYNVLLYPGSCHNAIFSLCDSEGEFCSDINKRVDGYYIIHSISVILIICMLFDRWYKNTKGRLFFDWVV